MTHPSGLKPNEVQTYAFDTVGQMMHAGPREVPPRGIKQSTIRGWAREWRAWAMASVPADCPTGVTVRTKRHGSWLLVDRDGAKTWYDARGCILSRYDAAGVQIPLQEVV